MPKTPRLTPLVACLPTTVPFVGPEAQERARGRKFRARLGANESSFGPSPAVIAAMNAAAPGMWMYCDPDNYDLKAALAAFFGVDIENVVVGEGIDGLLNLVVRMYVAPGEAVVTSLGAYPTFNFHVAGFGGRLVTVPFENDLENLDGLLAAVEARERAAGLSLQSRQSDGNMVGGFGNRPFHRGAAGDHDAHPRRGLWRDGAGIGAAAARHFAPERHHHADLSKAYGLAGIRCGYAIGEAEVIRQVEKVRNHYGVSRMAQIAGLTALADQAYLKEVVAKVAAGRQRIARIAKENGLSPIRSATNFVTIDCGGDGALALKIMQGLLSRDVFVRKPMAPKLDRCIRVSVGLDHELTIFEEELPGVVAAARGN